MTLEDPDRYDPEIIGPGPERCVVCFSRISDRRSFCLTCGNRGLFFSVSAKAPGKFCIHHPDASAATYCTLCGRPVCSDCVEREGRLLFAQGRTPQCSHCIAEMEDIKDRFFSKLDELGCCAKHPKKEAITKCVSYDAWTCNLPLCELCDYYRRVGFFRRRRGPYCLGCYRVAPR